MRRAWVEKDKLSAAAPGDRVQLHEDAAHHLERVLRLAPGDEVELFDGEGRVASARLETGGAVTILQVRQAVAPLPPLVVAQAVVRGPKLEEVVRRATELSASAVVVFDAQRSNAPSVRLDRLERVVQQAARQAERAFVPSLVGPVSFAELLEQVRAFSGCAAMGVVGAERPLSQRLAEDPRFSSGGMLFVVGPEGGLSGEEQALLLEAGCAPVAIGVHVLRTETAGLAALACAQVAAGVM